MKHLLRNYMTPRNAAIKIGIEYSTLMARVRKGKIKSIKMGWSTLIHKDEVKRAKREEKKYANRKRMERSTR